MSSTVSGNLYDLLGIPATATPEQIKAAYRRQAKELHPDINPGGERRFKELAHAYEVLSDPDQRARYDAGLPPDQMSDEEVNRQMARVFADVTLGDTILDLDAQVDLTMNGHTDTMSMPVFADDRDIMCVFGDLPDVISRGAPLEKAVLLAPLSSFTSVEFVAPRHNRTTTLRLAQPSGISLALSVDAGVAQLADLKRAWAVHASTTQHRSASASSTSWSAPRSSPPPRDSTRHDSSRRASDSIPPEVAQAAALCRDTVTASTRKSYAYLGIAAVLLCIAAAMTGTAAQKGGVVWTGGALIAAFLGVRAIAAQRDAHRTATTVQRMAGTHSHLFPRHEYTGFTLAFLGALILGAVIAIASFNAAISPTWSTSPPSTNTTTTTRTSPTAPTANDMVGTCWSEAAGAQVENVACTSSAADWKVTQIVANCPGAYLRAPDGREACLSPV